jgi:hypothetical protein
MREVTMEGKAVPSAGTGSNYNTYLMAMSSAAC